MKQNFLEIEHFVLQQLNVQPLEEKDIPCAVFHIRKDLHSIDSLKLNFHWVLLCKKGHCTLSVGHHDFVAEASSISIIPPHTLLSAHNFSSDFEAYFLLFKSSFIKKGFVKSEIMEELLFINPDYPPTFPLESSAFDDTAYKFLNIKEEIENQQPFCLEISRLYVLQILFDYNRVCEICLLNSDKLLNREYQVMYEFRKLVDQHFRKHKTVKEYADIMFLSPKYISECVKNQTGISALTLIHHRLVLEAEFLLTYSSHSVKEVADQLGFSSVSTFSRFFKEKKGISPAQYQQNRKN